LKSKGVDHKLDEEEEEESEYESSYENYSIISYKRDSEMESSDDQSMLQIDEDDAESNNDSSNNYNYKDYKNRRLVTEADVKPNRKETDCINKKVQ
jgi:hypothetical protein